MNSWDEVVKVTVHVCVCRLQKQTCRTSISSDRLTYLHHHRHRITLTAINNKREPDNKVGELVTPNKTYMHQYHRIDVTRFQNKSEPDNKVGELAHEQVTSRSHTLALRNRVPENKDDEPGT